MIAILTFIGNLFLILKKYIIKCLFTYLCTLCFKMINYNSKLIVTIIFNLNIFLIKTIIATVLEF